MPQLILNPRLSIHYTDPAPAGSPAVLLLHGLGANGDSWQLQTPVLVEHGYRVIIPDARGFGRSTYPGGSVSIAQMAADIIAVLHHCQVKQAHVVGISMGGTHALQLALTRPDLVRSLTLANTFASLRPNRPGIWAYFLLRFLVVHLLGLEPQARTVTRRIFPHPSQEIFRQELYHQILQADVRGYRAVMRALARFNVSSRLAEIKSPTLIITGANDSTVPSVNQGELARRIPGARQVIIADAGHAVSVEKADAFNQALLEFFAEQSSTSKLIASESAPRP